MQGENLKLEFPQLSPGQWVYLHLYGDDMTPEGLGWAQLDTKKFVHIVTTDIPDGNYSITAVQNDGTLSGWIDLSLGKVEKTPAVVAAPVAVQPRVVVQQAPLMRPLDWWLITASLAVIALSGVAVRFGVVRNRKN